MPFDDSFVVDLPDDPEAAVSEAAQRYVEFARSAQARDVLSPSSEVGGYMRAHAVLEALCEVHNIQNMALTGFSETDDPESIASAVGRSYKAAQKWLASGHHGHLVQDMKTRYRALLTQGKYLFPNDDYARIQVILNELRDIILKSETIPADHRDRLLEALEAFQAALNKRVSDVDGLVGKALGIYYQVRPHLLDAAELVHELVGIIWRGKVTQAQLPAGSSLPQLPAPAEDE